MTRNTLTEDRWDAARQRAIEQRVRLQVIEPRRRYQTTSQSQDDTTYELYLLSDGWFCECPGFQFTNVCKHVAALHLRAEREGWAPLPNDAGENSPAHHQSVNDDANVAEGDGENSPPDPFIDSRTLAVAILRGPR